MNFNQFDYAVQVSGGNDSIALLQLCIDRGYKFFAVYCDTKWSADFWEERIQSVEKWLSEKGIVFVKLQSEGFEKSVIRNKMFPNTHVRFCTRDLKTKPFSNWLDSNDPEKNLIIVVGVRREESKARANFPEWTEESKPNGGRSLFAPMVTFTEEQRNDLIIKAGFDVLSHRSKECSPCIFAKREDFSFLDEQKIKTIENLETKLNGVMFNPRNKMGASGIREVIKWAKGYNVEEQMDLFGCDSGFCSD